LSGHRSDPDIRETIVEYLLVPRSKHSRATRKVIYARLIFRALTSSDSCWAYRLIDFPRDMAYISNIRVAFVMVLPE
jgi:hypothetical protein